MKFLSLFLVVAAAAALSAADLATTNDWPSYGGTHAALRYSALDQINTANVKRLAPAWIFQTGDYENGLLATPIVIDGVIYLSTSNAWVFALDGATGKHRRRCELGSRGRLRVLGFNRKGTARPGLQHDPRRRGEFDPRAA